MPTKPKRNANFSKKPKGLCIFMKSLIPIAIGNGFSFEQEKRKSKTISFSFLRRRKRKVSLLPHYA